MGQKTLGELQRWMLAEITRLEGAGEGAVAKVILPSQDLTAAERLEVYRSAYFARLLEVLREQFPCTRFAVGEELFDELARGYLQCHPPHSYTLGQLADHWVEYLEATRPADWGGFVVELARLEEAIDRIFDGAGPERSPLFEMPAEATSSVRLTLAVGLELLAFGYPVSSYYTAWKSSQQPAWPEAAEQFVALLRRDYIVRRHELSGAQFRLLAALARGLTIGEALTEASAGIEVESVDAFARSVRGWFEWWASQGFFAGAQEVGSEFPGG